MANNSCIIYKVYNYINVITFLPIIPMFLDHFRENFRQRGLGLKFPESQGDTIKHAYTGSPEISVSLTFIQKCFLIELSTVEICKNK